MEFNIQSQGSTDIAGLTLDGLGQELNPAVPGSLAHRVSLQRAFVDSFTPDVVPQGETPQALEDAIWQFAKSHGLPLTRRVETRQRAGLVRTPQPGPAHRRRRRVGDRRDKRRHCLAGSPRSW